MKSRLVWLVARSPLATAVIVWLALRYRPESRPGLNALLRAGKPKSARQGRD